MLSSQASVLRLFLISFGLILLSWGPLSAASLDIHWNGEIKVVGDIHGDFEALKALLIDHELIDARTLRWISKRKTLVIFMGDLVGKGRQSKEVMDFLMSLQRQAQKKQSRIEVLWGNHEALLLAGDDYYIAEDDRALRQLGIKMLSRTPNVYSQWLRRRPGFLRVHIPSSTRSNKMKIGFIHAGLDEFVRSHSPKAFNDELKRMVDVAEAGGFIELSWALNPDGGLWSRKMARGQLSEEEFNEYLKAYDIDRLVVGHTPTKDYQFRVLRRHPRYGRRLILADSGISEAIGGNIEILTIRKSSMSVRRTPRPCRESLEEVAHLDDLEEGISSVPRSGL